MRKLILRIAFMFCLENKFSALQLHSVGYIQLWLFNGIKTLSKNGLVVLKLNTEIRMEMAYWRFFTKL